MKRRLITDGLLVALLLLAGFFSGFLFSMKVYRPAVAVDYRDEIPGLSATPSNPDLAAAYVKPGTDTVFLERLQPNWPDPKIRVVDWPEEFGPILHQDGEINSPMRFTEKGDTLYIEFVQD